MVTYFSLVSVLYASMLPCIEVFGFVASDFQRNDPNIYRNCRSLGSVSHHELFLAMRKCYCTHYHWL